MTGNGHKEWSRQTLEATYLRAVQLLRGAGTHPEILVLLRARGYRDEDHTEGWRLVLAAGGSELTPPAVVAAAVTAGEAIDAAAQIHAWEAPTHRLIEASWQRRYPEQLSFTLAGLALTNRQDSVPRVAMLLERLDSLEKGQGRSRTRKADRAALALLTERALTPEQRTQMGALVLRAQKGEAPAAMPALEVQKEQARRKQAHHEALLALRAWYEEWSAIARLAVTRRDQLIQLGLARRKATRAGK